MIEITLNCIIVRPNCTNTYFYIFVFISYSFLPCSFLSYLLAFSLSLSHSLFFLPSFLPSFVPSFFSFCLSSFSSQSVFLSFHLAVNASAQKLSIVFERMFLEVVLAWDAPLPFVDSCHACRSPDSVSETKWVQCER